MQLTCDSVGLGAIALFKKKWLQGRSEGKAVWEGDVPPPAQSAGAQSTIDIAGILCD